MVYSIATIPSDINFTLAEYNISEDDTIGERIRTLRKIQKLTSKELGEKVGLTAAGIINYENNMVYPPRKIILRLYKILGEDLLCDGYSRFIVKDYRSILENWRLKNNLTKRETAKKLNMSESFYSELIKGKYELTHSFFIKIENKLKDIKLAT
ncbi:helix-turn-helix transcriptional regulator [Clostridium cochlearium]|uniref:helix-turn-helix domain-containing protein n=1 Tax=Clostridium cochlearium TaxID=1494 RepID=UPI001459BD81|nr:helix-turn-helix transcriptional regulator [Clostridium cochlearium]NME95388.1 helix-turn-helix transcriptional regulator [Clostridium cochlearium]